jgi:PqqD family protein of HPr-rel-A system
VSDGRSDGATRFSAPPDGYRIVALDELSAVYHRASGITHVVASPAPEILDALSGPAMSADALLMVLTIRYDLADADPAALAARLDELLMAGLVVAQ